MTEKYLKTLREISRLEDAYAVVCDETIFTVRKGAKQHKADCALAYELRKSIGWD